MVHIEPSTISMGHISSPEQGEPCVMVIFGASGDLTKRKLLPALFSLFAAGQLPDCFHVIGFARSSGASLSFRNEMAEQVEGFLPSGDFNREVWEKFSRNLHYHQGDYSDRQSYASLDEKISAIESDCGLSGNRVYYLATPPGLCEVILDNLKSAGMVERGKPWRRVIIEKPFGHDYNSARELNSFVAGILDEKQTFRIDHYLGKETVQNLLVFRFGNAIFEPLWNRNSIDHVQITASESIGVESRGGFYDGAGVIRDFVQNHLLEVLALCAMEQPVSFRADPVRDEKVKVLRSLRPLVGPEVLDNVVAGQYRGYLDVDGVRPDSRTPTYTAMKIMIDNWRWQGVPFYLRAGKMLPRRLTEIAIHFHGVPYCLFGQEEVCQRLPANVLRIRIQPEEGISLQFACKTPGENMDVSDVIMDFAYSEAFGRPTPDAYERLLLDAMRGDATLFARRDEVEHAWKFVTPVLEELDSGRAKIAPYDPGMSGPAQADEFILRDGRHWDEL